MEQLRKVVAVGCLTYVLYGLISWFQLGAFLPPLPIKPLVFLVFALFGSINAFQKGVTIIDITFLSWLILISIINQHFLELLFSTESIVYFQESVEVYLQLLAVILFSLFNLLIILKLVQNHIFFSAYFLVLALLIGGLFFLPKHIGLEESSIAFGTLYFLSVRFMSSKLDVSLQRVIILFGGVGLFELIDWVILH